MRLRPLTFLTFQQFPFFSPFRQFIVFPVIYFIIPSPYNHSSIVPPFIHHPSHLFIIPVIYSLIPPLYRHSIHSILILQPFQPFIVALRILVISTISPSFPPSLRNSHHLSVFPTVFPSHRSVTPSHTAVFNNNCSKIIF